MSNRIISLSFSSLEVEGGFHFIHHTFPEVKVPSSEIMALLLTSLFWANYLTSLHLSFFIYKMGILLSRKANVVIKQVNVCS